MESKHERGHKMPVGLTTAEYQTLYNMQAAGGSTDTLAQVTAAYGPGKLTAQQLAELKAAIAWAQTVGM